MPVIAHGYIVQPDSVSYACQLSRPLSLHNLRSGIQKLVALPEGRGLWLTYARYTTPDGEAIQGHGLTPQLAVDEPDVDFDQQKPTTDPVLDAAIARTKKIG